MSDEWSEDLLPAEFEIDGKIIRLDVVNTSDRFGQAWSRHAYPHRRGARHRHMGADARITRCSLVFLPPNVLDRFLELQEANDAGKIGLFTHPLFGSYDAHIEDLEVEARGEERDYLTARCTFVEEITSAEDIRRPDLFGEIADRSTVDAALNDLETELETAGLTSTAPGAVTTQLDTWESEETTDRRKLGLELAALSNAIQDETDRLDLATDVGNYPVITAFVTLQNNLRNFAERLISQEPALTTYTVKVRRPLLAILQDLYGASGALERLERTLQMNDILEPAAVPAGSVLTVEVA